MLSTPFLQEYGLAPVFNTLPSHPTHIPVAVTSFEYAVFCSNGTTTHFHDEIKAKAAFMGHQGDTFWMQKPSSSTTTSPPETPLPTSARSGFSFFHWLFVRVTYALLTTEAALFLRLTGFFRTNGPLANTFPLVIKDSEKDLRSEAELLAFQQCNRRQRRSQPVASLHDTPTNTYVDEATQVTSAPPVSATRTSTYVDKATEVTTSLPASPTPSPTNQSPPTQSSFRSDAAMFVPHIPQAKAPMTREQFNEFVHQHPMHGKRVT
ncbi:MAG: hypothetical protein LQ343_003122 [Gyalolechia ehrenbergii]|nr:MAG: hypothetical protein LQ343_003122 [Gyalolechia ehrenbergii]